jgi:signal peptidase I
MSPTLVPGDWILLNKSSVLPVHFVPRHQILRGDIVVFHYPARSVDLYVKRAVGLPGDRVKIIGGALFINGIPLFEPYVHHVRPTADYLQNFPQDPNAYPVSRRAIQMLQESVQNGEVLVPSDNLFVLGDYREGSFDSRSWGFIPNADVVGIAKAILWSEDPDGCDFNVVETGGCYWKSIRWSRFLHPIQTVTYANASR